MQVHQKALGAWRQLARKREPSSGTRHAGLLVELLGYRFEGDLTERLEVFARDNRRYAKSSNEPLSERIRVGVLMTRIPE